MKKLLVLILIFSSFLFAREYKSYTYAYVTHSEPIYEYRYDKVYNEVCDDEYYYETSYDEPRYNYNRRNDVGLDTLVGATIGVAIGNQIGKGNGRTAAKVVGGILGASIANNTRYQREYANYDRRQVKRRYKECHDSSYTQRKSRVLVGYKNYFSVKNREYYKVTDRPRDRIKVTHIVRF